MEVGAVVMDFFHPVRGTAGHRRGKCTKNGPTRTAFCQITLVLFPFAHFQVGRHSALAGGTMFACSSAGSGARNPRDWWSR